MGVLLAAAFQWRLGGRISDCSRADAQLTVMEMNGGMCRYGGNGLLPRLVALGSAADRNLARELERRAGRVGVVTEARHRHCCRAESWPKHFAVQEPSGSIRKQAKAIDCSCSRHPGMVKTVLDEQRSASAGEVDGVQCAPRWKCIGGSAKRRRFFK